MRPAPNQGAIHIDITGVPATRVAELVRSGEASPVEILEGTLDRVERLNPSINAFVNLRPDGARADAKTVDAAVRDGRDPGPFAGVPFAVKDLVATEDMPMTLGSRAFEGFRPGVDAVLVQRMKAAGAILVGTTNTPELGAKPTTENPLYGPTRNPWNPELTSGGSSGGSAAAVAAGLVPISEASDGGGSIRIPSSCCGIFGLKPQRGRISLGPLVSEGWGGLTVTGPVARTVADAAAMLDVVAGPSTGDFSWAPPPDRPFSAALTERRPLRIGVLIERDGIETDPEVADAVAATADLLRGAGHDVFDAPAPPIAGMEEGFVLMTTAGIGSAPVPPDKLDLLDERNKLIFEVARNITVSTYLRARFAVQAQARALVAFLDDMDLLLTPTLAHPPRPVGELGADIVNAWEDYRRWLAFLWPFNVTGQPAASVPGCFTADGVPIGVQLVGRPADEHTVISAAAQLEELRPWAERRPTVW